MVSKIKLTDVPDLVSMVDKQANEFERIDISGLSVNSSKVICWKCSNGHTFKGKISTVFRRKNKCFYCTGRAIASGENDLQTLYPDLASEFDILQNGITPDKISPKDTKAYIWTCKNKHPSFRQQVNHRVTRQTICPYCSGRKIIKGLNDLETLYPEIAKEWDIEGNGGVLPQDVSAYTYNSYKWICPKGHSYAKKVVHRTRYHKPIDCPKCVKAKSTSFPEQAIYFYVKKCFPDAVNRYKEPFDNGMELDIFIPFYKMGIEYDGINFHNDDDQHERELRKYQICKKLGIKLIRIKESTNTWADTADDIFYVKKRMKDEELSNFIRTMFSLIFGFHMHTFPENNKYEQSLNRNYGFPFEFNISKDRPQIMEYLVDIEHSFGSRYPELAANWSKEKNGNLTPFMFTSGSNYQATWECSKCHSTWMSPISSIVQRNAIMCKTCSMKENGKTITRVKTKKNGCLAEKSELLLKQWDYEANGDLSPYNVPFNYSFDVVWRCDLCGYRWHSSPNSRVRGEKVSNCPHCTGRVALPGVDDLETLFPKIAKEWDYEKNDGILPSQIKPYSNKKYFWICPKCNNSYPAYPGNRVSGTGCPMCARLKIGKKNAKIVGQYDKNGELVNTYYGLHEAARAMNVNSNSIFQAVKNGGKSKGYYWKYI